MTPRPREALHKGVARGAGRGAARAWRSAEKGRARKICARLSAAKKFHDKEKERG